MTAALSLPLVAPWVHPDQSEPITPVLRHRAASPGPARIHRDLAVRWHLVW
jgi:hypothetical protein